MNLIEALKTASRQFRWSRKETLAEYEVKPEPREWDVWVNHSDTGMSMATNVQTNTLSSDGWSRIRVREILE